MPTKRTNISIPEGLYDLAQKVMASRHYDSFSEYIAELVRADAFGKQAGGSDSRINEKGDDNKGPQKKARCAIATDDAARTQFFSVPRNVAVPKPD